MLKSMGLVAFLLVAFLMAGHSFFLSGERLFKEVKKVAALMKGDDPER